MPTIHDVAASAGVSAATVSRVLSRPTKVAEATRRHVIQVMKRLGYSPTAAAMSLRTFVTRKILVTVPDIANPFFSLIIQGIEEAAQRQGYAVVLGNTHHDPEREERYAQMLLRREADGLIFLGHRLPQSLRGWKRGPGKYPPIVNGCEYSPRLGVPSAHIDNAAAAAAAIDHLHSLGHSDIGIVTGPLASPLSRDRLRGVMARAQAVRVRPIVAHGDFSVTSGTAAAAHLLAGRPRPTAIFCFNDEMAMGVLEYAAAQGVKVPEQLSVIGFDDIRFARYVQPALTTVSQPMLDIGRETVRLLLEVLQGGLTLPVSVTLPHRLIIRHSTAPCSAAPRAAMGRARG